MAWFLLACFLNFFPPLKDWLRVADEAYFDNRGMIGDEISATMSDVQKLQKINQRLKSSNLKAAFDLFLAASMSESPSANEVELCVENVRKFERENLCPFFSPLLLQMEPRLR
jgi:hypothetical protein